MTNVAAVVTSGNQTVWRAFGYPAIGSGLHDSDLSGNPTLSRIAHGVGNPAPHGSPIDEFAAQSRPTEAVATHTFETDRETCSPSARRRAGTACAPRSARKFLSMANWSPDGNAIAVVRPATQHGARAARVPPGVGEPRLGPAMARVRAVSDTGPLLVVPRWLLDHQGIGARELQVYLVLASFADNGREVYFKSHDRNDLRASLWSVPVDGGRPRLLVRFDDPERASNRFDFASDGKRFYFTIEDRRASKHLRTLPG